MTNTPYASAASSAALRDPSHLGPAVQLRHVTQTYGAGTERQVRALDNVSLELPAGSFTAVMGPSGSGKSSLLHCAAGLDRPTTGSVLVDGTNLGDLDEALLTRFRRDRIGFVFQSFNLLPTLTVAQNVTLPLELGGFRPDHRAVGELLGRLGIADRSDHRPFQLSGGQQQRAAIARAVLGDPAVIFADEPTGALDSNAAREVMELLRATVDEMDRTLVMVTHDPVAAAFADTVVFLVNGRIDGTLDRPTAATVASRMTRLGESGQGR